MLLKEDYINLKQEIDSQGLTKVKHLRNLLHNFENREIGGA